MQSRLLTAAFIVLSCCCADVLNQPPNLQFESLLLSESGFVKAQSVFCLPERFIRTEPAAGPYLELGAKEACARACWHRPDCRGFRLGQLPPLGVVCKFFTFDSCSEELIDTDCLSNEVIWLRWRPRADMSRQSPLCPISFQSYQQGTARFRLVSVAGQPDGWLAGLHRCRHPDGMVKFADADTVEEATYLKSLLQQGQVKAAYLSGYFGFQEGQLRWLWQPCGEAITDSVLQSGLVTMWHNFTVVADQDWDGNEVNFAICECTDPFQVLADEA
ncbi:hypothetical protein BOX15_Mlig005454g1 [Macrostomum lignano]|uniref:C-type lectin domain-containing protein n=2 Tax=Macrostomum lignano TaxID=282301 RepID=A0A267EAK8_9PLAT|nr:hypothetical protein BOX15_Mlig005454g1 [Macrostomum lignano]